MTPNNDALFNLLSLKGTEEIKTLLADEKAFEREFVDHRPAFGRVDLNDELAVYESAIEDGSRMESAARGWTRLTEDERENLINLARGLGADEDARDLLDLYI